MGCKGRWVLEFKPRPGSHRKERPRGSKVVEGRPQGFGEGERRDHAALKEGVNHEALKQVDR